MRRRRASVIPDAGRRIYAARTHLGLTRTQLAEGAGVSDRAIAGWEREGKTPNATQLGAVVNWLRSQYDLDLYSWDPTARTDPGVRDKIMDLPGFTESQKRAMIAAIAAMDEDVDG